MKNLEFPIIGTLDTVNRSSKTTLKKYDLNSPKGRKVYFEDKVSDEISRISKYLNQGKTFIAYMLGKKGSGKGTYTKLMAEIFGEDKIAHISVGDLIREIDDWENFQKTDRYKRMKSYYRGYTSWDEAVDAHLGRNTSKLLPDEFILALLKAHIDELKGKCLFLDGLPRNMDQISYSLYFRDLINYRDDPDLFVLIDIPETVIDERIKHRVVCPTCHLSRNVKLLITSNVTYDEKTKKFNLICDNSDCPDVGNAVLTGKEGDELGLAPIRERLDRDEDLLKTAFKLHGVPKILLRNHVPVESASEYFDNYELTPEYVLKSSGKKVDITEKPWVVIDDNGKKCYSLLPPPVIVALVKQLAEVLEV
jgi:adenylate kinase family enzyme